MKFLSLFLFGFSGIFLYVISEHEWKFREEKELYKANVCRVVSIAMFFIEIISFCVSAIYWL